MTIDCYYLLKFENVSVVDELECFLFISEQWFGSLIVDGGKIYIFDGNDSVSSYVVAFVDWASGSPTQELAFTHNILSYVDLCVFCKHFLF